MEEFTIVLNDKIFKFIKNQYNFYEVTPYDENINVSDLSNALIEQKGYYISNLEPYNPQPVKDIENDGNIVIPFCIKEKCFFAQIEKSKSNKL